MARSAKRWLVDTNYLFLGHYSMAFLFTSSDYYSSSRPAASCGSPQGLSSKHLKLVTHRIPESDVERTLCAARLHRPVGKPAKPLAHADGRDARHHDLGGIGRRDLGKGLARHAPPPPSIFICKHDGQHTPRDSGVGRVFAPEPQIAEIGRASCRERV